MTIEQDSSHPIASDSIVKDVEQMETIWQTLPDEHKVSLALKFVDTIMASDYRPYYLYLSAQKWPLKTEELESAFPTIEISEEDLLRANLDDEEVAQLTDEQRQKMAEVLRSHYIHDQFWPEVQYLARVFLSGQSGIDS